MYPVLPAAFRLEPSSVIPFICLGYLKYSNILWPSDQHTHIVVAFCVLRV